MNRKSTVFIVVVWAVLTWAFAHAYNVPGDCMESAIKDGGHVFVHHMSPYMRQCRLGDIVAFNHEGKAWVSRIVVLETDTVQIAEGSVIVNGATYQDDAIQRNWSNWGHGTYAVDKPLQVPPVPVFVLSDNLAAQHDDRRVFGPISKDSIIGLVW